MAFKQLIYASAAVKPFTPEELRQLLAVARKNNAPLGVSGMLLYHEGSFMQVLEGAAEKVLGLEERIRQDPRHHRMVTISNQNVDFKQFEEWSMGFVNPSIEHLDGFSEFLVDGKLSLLHHQGRAQKMVDKFRDGFWRQAIKEDQAAAA